MVFVIKTRLGPSSIAGTGVFAAEPVKAGDLVWRFLAPIDLAFDEADAAAWPEAVRGYMKVYAYFDRHHHRYIHCGDNARFVNHSADPNTIAQYPPDIWGGVDVAARDIQEGEELTGDYFDWDLTAKDKL